MLSDTAGSFVFFLLRFNGETRFFPGEGKVLINVEGGTGNDISYSPGKRGGAAAHSCAAFNGAFCLNDCHRINTVAAALT